MIEIKPYSREFEDKHIDFASNYWNKSRRKIPEYIYWKFRGNSKESMNSFILAIQDDVVVGQLGLIPCKLNVEGIIYDAQWACDLMVDINLRGKGIANELYSFAHKLKPITLGSDPSPAASKSMKKNGYFSVKGPNKFIFATKLGELAKLKGVDNRLLNYIYNPFYVFYMLLFKFQRSSFSKCSINDYNEIAKDSIFKEEKIHINYDSEFINWRFYPFKNYYKGVSIFKNNNNFFSGYFGNSTFYIAEFKVKGVFDFFKIVSFLLYKYSDLKRIRFCCNPKFISKWLPYVGFVKFRSGTEIIYFTEDPVLRKNMSQKEFYYTFVDSDENI